MVNRRDSVSSTGTKVCFMVIDKLFLYYSTICASQSFGAPDVLQYHRKRLSQKLAYKQKEKAS